MNLYEEFFAIARALNESGARYAVVGGLAMAFHGKPRFTRDIDILLAAEDIGIARTVFDRLGYCENPMPLTFRATNLTLHRFARLAAEGALTVDVLLANSAEHEEVIANAISAKSREDVVRVATKQDIIWMKRSRNSDQDKVDIRELQNDKDREGRKNRQ